MSIAFIACVEAGRLERQTVLLCRSLRRFGGKYRDAPFFTFQPRAGLAVSSASLHALRQLGVEHNTEVLNDEFREYGVLNKVFVCARAEELLTHHTLVFVDSDTVFVGEPSDLDLKQPKLVAVRPAESAFLNSTGPTDPHDNYWQATYRICGIRNEAWVTTELGRHVRAFFSAGLIATRRNASLYRQWRDTFEMLVRSGHIHPTGLRRMDEVALAATLTPIFDSVALLDDRYNYLIYRRSWLASRWCNAQLSDLIHVHYRNSFSKPGFLETVEPPLDPGCEILGWLKEFLPLD